MKFWTYQTADCGCSRDDSILRIHRFAFWRWAWIWGKFVREPRIDPPQVHSAGAEVAYMNQHPEIWPLSSNLFSRVYAEHHITPSETSVRLCASGAHRWGVPDPVSGRVTCVMCGAVNFAIPLSEHAKPKKKRRA